MLYPVICVPGRVNGGLHEILIVEESMKEYDKALTEDNGPEMRDSNDCCLSYACVTLYSQCSCIAISVHWRTSSSTQYLSVVIQ